MIPDRLAASGHRHPVELANTVTGVTIISVFRLHLLAKVMSGFSFMFKFTTKWERNIFYRKSRAHVAVFVVSFKVRLKDTMV